MADVEIERAEIRQAERADDVPDAEEVDDGVGLDHCPSSRGANPTVLDTMTEVQRRGGAAAEADDVACAVVVLPVLAQLVVCFVDARQLAEAEHAAGDLADDVPAGADAGYVEVVGLRVVLVSTKKTRDVRVRVALIVVVFRFVPRAVESVQRHTSALGRGRVDVPRL